MPTCKLFPKLSDDRDMLCFIKNSQFTKSDNERKLKQNSEASLAFLSSCLVTKLEFTIYFFTVFDWEFENIVLVSVLNPLLLLTLKFSTQTVVYIVWPFSLLHPHHTVVLTVSPYGTQRVQCSQLDHLHSIYKHMESVSDYISKV